jgi:translation initiation factor 2 subunit 2
VLAFVLAELGTTGDIGESKGLTIRGRYSSLNFEQLLRKYIQEYVTCKTCHSPDTVLKKENRIEFKCCNTCSSTSSVASVCLQFSCLYLY